MKGKEGVKSVLLGPIRQLLEESFGDLLDGSKSEDRTNPRWLLLRQPFKTPANPFEERISGPFHPVRLLHLGLFPGPASLESLVCR